MATFNPVTPLDIPKIASYAPGDQMHFNIEIGQVEHRMHLLNAWQIKPGSRVLEIGCGQGTTTTCLAYAVGPNGHIDAIDPASPDYGSPFTLAEAQAHISLTDIGSRITWHNMNLCDFLTQNPTKMWDNVVFAHCIWYFDSPDILSMMLSALRGRVGNLLIAEHALRATKRDAEPHLLAAIARASLEAHNKSSCANIRCLLSPTSIKDAARKTGWGLGREAFIVPDIGLRDGHWETSEVADKEFLEEVDKQVQDSRVKTMLRSSRDAVIAAAAAVEGNRVLTMDCWVAQFQEDIGYSDI